MDRREEDIGALAWPGFVDILSAVIIMFIFFIMITAIVMSVMSVEHKKQVEQDAEEQVSQELTDVVEMIETKQITIEDVKNSLAQQQKITDLTQEKETLSDKVDELSEQVQSLKANIGETQDISIDISDEDDALTVFYDRNGISLSEEVVTLIKEFSGRYEDNPQAQFNIIANENPQAPSISTAREIGLGRALNIRNSLIEAGVLPAHIAISYQAKEALQENYNWVRIEVVR